MKKLNYKSYLIIWIAIGILISGYFYIYPIQYRVHRTGSDYEYWEGRMGPSYEDGKQDKIAILITLVGAILISGLGHTLSKKK